MIKQSQGYGCGMYAVANACNLKDFCTDERLDASKEYGNNIGQLSKWMQEDGMNFYIDALYYNQHSKELPSYIYEIKPSGDEKIKSVPILMQVSFSETSKYHLIGLKVAKDGTVFLYDSLKSKVIETTMAEIPKMYYQISGVFCFISLDGNGYVFIMD